MSEQIQLLLDPKGLVTLLLKEKGIHEGLWSFIVEFQLSLGLAGPSPDTASPTAMASVLKVGIQKGTQLNSITFDAAELNPAPKVKRVRKTSAE